MAFNVTQCPVCESTFNTNARILESAVGRVRCGACLAVFDAAKNYTEESDSDSEYHAEESVFVGNNPQEFFDPSLFLTRSALTEVDDTAVSTELENSDDEVLVDEDVLLGYEQAEVVDQDFVVKEEEEEEEEEEEGLVEEKLAEEILAEETVVEKINDHEELIEPASSSKSYDESPQSSDSNEQKNELAESFAEDLQQKSPETPDHKWELLESHSEETEDSIASEIEDADKITQIESAEAQHVQLHLPVESPVESPEESFKSNVDANRDGNPDVENNSYKKELKSPILDWSALEDEPSPTGPPQEEIDEPAFTIESNADEPEAEHSSDTEPQKELEKEESINAEEIADNKSLEEQPEESTAAIRARALETELEDEEALEAIPEENLAALGKMSAPLELSLETNSRWGRRVALSLSIVFLGALLAAQFLWQGIGVYSQRAQIRPFYALTCNWVNCELPAYSEIGAIRSDNLVVRSHPELANGLMINTTIRNTADFPQAFPIMVLSFNSASNSIVALREFAPEEYLDPGLQSFTAMPVMTPVQIDLEIIDPGPDAVNYTLAFRLP